MLTRLAYIPGIRPVARAAREAIVRCYRPIHRKRGFLRDRQIVFILSHMRAGSSVLTRVLSSHPEVCGVGELHRVYRTELDLDDLTIWLAWYAGSKLRQSRFVLDKLLHNRLLPDPALLTRANIKCIFLLREPESSIKSMVTRLSRRDVFGNPERAVEYYTARLARLADMVKYVEPENAVMLDYSALTHETESSLRLLREFLGLQLDLSPEYEVDEALGRWERSDGSEHILKGVLHRAQTNYGIELPADLLDAAMDSYAETTQEIRSRVSLPDRKTETHDVDV